jgi:hypothetical protein
MLLQLRTEQLLTSSKGIVAIPDIAALRRVGEFQPTYLHARVPHGTSADDQIMIVGDGQ